MEIQYRLATLQDTEEVLQMMEAFYQIDHYLFEAAITRENIIHFIGNPALGRLWIVEIDQHVAGYIALTFGFSFEFKGKDAFIDEFFLKEPFRQQGVGTKTLQFVLQEAEMLGVKAVHLEVEKHNEAGKKLYRKLQFKDHERYLMTKRLL